MTFDYDPLLPDPIIPSDCKQLAPETWWAAILPNVDGQLTIISIFNNKETVANYNRHVGWEYQVVEVIVCPAEKFVEMQASIQDLYETCISAALLIEDGSPNKAKAILEDVASRIEEIG